MRWSDHSMRVRAGNLFADVSAAGAGEEVFNEIFAQPGLKIERIISRGQASPTEFSYDQAWNERVIVLKGSATLQFEDEPATRALSEGDYVFIPGTVESLHQVWAAHTSETREENKEKLTASTVWSLYRPRERRASCPNRITRRIKHPESGAMLQGKLFDDKGNRMSPSFSSKNGARYRFYVSTALRGRKHKPSFALMHGWLI
jgi:cupin 2 domain-containing protein